MSVGSDPSLIVVVTESQLVEAHACIKGMELPAGSAKGK